jgi:hypothetical protein
VRVRRHATFETLSISALDLFASSLGAFMLLALMLFPFWLKQPGLQAATAAAEARLADAERMKADATAAIAALSEEQLAADRALSQARERLAAAEVADAAAQQQAVAASAEKARRTAGADAAARAAAAAPKPVAAKRKPGIAIDDLDLVIVMDTTGSMRNELADAQANLVGVIEVLQRLSPSLRVGFVAYKDRGDDYVTRVFPLAPVGGGGSAPVLSFVRALTVGGGGDDPDAVDAALAVAISQPWRSNAQGRILVIGDAAVHPTSVARTFDLARQFRASGSQAAPRSVATVFAGGGRPGDRDFFQQLAQAGGGDFSEYQGAMLESVLLSVLESAKRGS